MGRNIYWEFFGADFAPGAIVAVFQGVAKYVNSKRTGPTTEVSRERVQTMEFDVLREKAEARMAAGSGFPGDFAPILCAQDAALSVCEKFLALASFRSTLSSPEVARQTRRRNAARQEALLASDLDAFSEEEDFAAWVAFRKAK